MAASLAITGLASLYLADQSQEPKSEKSTKEAFSLLNQKFLNDEMKSEDVSSFLEWTAQYKKSYQTQEEFLQRMNVFVENMKKLNVHQAEFQEEEGEGALKLGLNKFADLTDAEYKAMLGFHPDKNKVQENVNSFKNATALPASIDWVAEGMVSEVKDQGACGSCWSFSTTGSIESAYKIKNGKDILLSEQQILECSVSFGNNGCSGGLVEYAYHYLESHSLETEAEYPYSATSSKPCKAVASEGKVELSSFKEVERFNPEELAQALQLGPVSIGVDASGTAMRWYKSGIIKKWCGVDIDHAVLLVGYGTEKGLLGSTDYWTVKNSWGADWGEKGYFRVMRDMTKKDEGMCGILQTPTYPIL